MSSRYILGLILIQTFFHISFAKTLCRDKYGFFKQCTESKKTGVKDLIEDYMKTYSVIRCHFNGSFTNCNSEKKNKIKIEKKEYEKENEIQCTLFNISKGFQIDLLYFQLSDPLNIGIIRDYIRNVSNDPEHISTNKTKIYRSRIISRYNPYLENMYSYVKIITFQLSKTQNNCSLAVFHFIFSDINYIFQSASRQMEIILRSYCNVSKILSFDSYDPRNVNRTLNGMIKELRQFLETDCLQNNSVTQEKKNVQPKKEDNGSSVTLLVPIVIVGFIIFSCILTMRFCSEGESTLMMRAKIMKYQPEKDKQLLALIYQQIQKEGKPQIENRLYSTNCNSKKSNKTSKSTERGIFACQPCCSKDVFRAPLVSTLAVGMAPLKKATS